MPKLALIAVFLAAAAVLDVVQAGGHGHGGHHVIIHVPYKVHKIYHTHTITKHVHHKDDGDKYEVLGYTVGHPIDLGGHGHGGHDFGGGGHDFGGHSFEGGHNFGGGGHDFGGGGHDFGGHDFGGHEGSFDGGHGGGYEAMEHGGGHEFSGGHEEYGGHH